LLRTGARWALELAEATLVAFVIALVLRTYVVGSFVIVGDSMNPTLSDGERVLVSRMAYRDGGPERGDVIVFRYPLDPGQDFVKRVVGLPGETVEMREGRVFVNGVCLEETYPVKADRSAFPPTRVPDGELFVLGDNRRVSEDSRSFGFVPLDCVRGKVLLVYWPPHRVEWVDAAAAGCG